MASVPPATKVPICVRLPCTQAYLVDVLGLHGSLIVKAGKCLVNMHKCDNRSWSTVKFVPLKGLHAAVMVGWANEALVSCESIQTSRLKLLALSDNVFCAFCSEQTPYVPMMQRIRKDNMSVTHVVWGGHDSTPRRIEYVPHAVHFSFNILLLFYSCGPCADPMLFMIDQTQTRNRFRFVCC